MPKLIIFDCDGTLTPDNKGTWFDANVAGKLATLRGQDIRLALASNQGGVGLRHWMEAAGFGKPDDYPTAAQVFSRLAEVANNVTALTLLSVTIYTCFAYQSKTSGKWTPTPEGSEDDPHWSPLWRKPAPGMLLQAMADAGVGPTDTLFVGDSDEDRQAAAAAGIEFVEAAVYFAENK